MFFYAAKIVWFLLQPSALLVILLLVGVLSVGFGFVRFGGVLAIIACLGLAAGGFLPIGSALLLPLENRFPRPSLDGPITGIIVLGGGIDQGIGEPRGVIALTEAGERMTEGVALARAHPEARLVFTGGSASIIPDRYTEGQQAQRLFEQLGVEDSRITIEDKSRDTAENARFTKALVQPKPGERWILVTSAWHMPRSVGCFRAVGWPVIAWPTDYRTSGSGDLTTLMPRPSYGLTLLDVAAKEWIGLIAYRLVGRIDSFFPGP